MSRDRLLLHALAVLATVLLVHAARAGEIEDTLTAAAEREGVSAWVLTEVARCESIHFRPDVVYGPTTGAEGEIGLLQLHPRGKLQAFFAAGYTNPWDPAQQARFGAEQFAAGQQGAWSCWWTEIKGQRPPWWR